MWRNATNCITCSVSSLASVYLYLFITSINELKCAGLCRIGKNTFGKHVCCNLKLNCADSNHGCSCVPLQQYHRHAEMRGLASYRLPELTWPQHPVHKI
jgi:hypothetical protein